MYMRVKGKTVEFDWNQANLSKSYFKHGVTPKETEDVFVDSKLLVIPDVKHSIFEERFIAVGKTLDQKTLFVVFTIRGKKIRVISARRMHKKEVRRYEEIRKS
jgi:uncharacterized DUF497 family protein